MGTLTPVVSLHPMSPISPCSFPAACDIPPRAWAIGHAVSLAANSYGFIVHAFTRQVSLLISFELPTIPSSTTAFPFRHDRFSTLRHRHDLPVSLSGTTETSLETTSHRQGFADCQLAPRQGWPNQVHFRYGLVVRLRLLSTWYHYHAVTTLDFRPVTLAWKGLAPLCSNAFTDALALSLRDRLAVAQPRFDFASSIRTAKTIDKNQSFKADSGFAVPACCAPWRIGNSAILSTERQGNFAEHSIHCSVIAGICLVLDSSCCRQRR